MIVLILKCRRNLFFFVVKAKTHLLCQLLVDNNQVLNLPVKQRYILFRK